MLHFETILCPIDFSKHSTMALRYAMQLATQYGSRLVIYHSVIPPVAVPVFPDRLQGGTVAMNYRDEMLDHYVGEIVPPAMANVKRVDFMAPAAGILKAAYDENADLIVMGTHGATGYEALLLGSVTHKVLHKTSIPVLAVCNPKHPIENEPIVMRKIVCAVEPKQQVSLKRLHLALSLARTYAATLVFLQVRESVEQESTLQELEDMVRPEKEEWCKVEYVSQRGNPIDEILRATEDPEADLLVIGHHIRRPGALEALGSVGLRVIPRSPCPVLVVRD